MRSISNQFFFKKILKCWFEILYKNLIYMKKRMEKFLFKQSYVLCNKQKLKIETVLQPLTDGALCNVVYKKK